MSKHQSGCTVHLCEQSNVKIPTYQHWLSAAEALRLDGITAESRRQTFLVGHWFLRLSLAERFGGQPDDWRVGQHESGALLVEQAAIPLPEARKMGVSLSHSGTQLACAIDPDAAVGIDIEQLSERRSLDDMVELYGSVELQQQWQQLQSGGQSGLAKLRLWYRWWCCYESWVKQQGRGIDLAEFGTMRLLASSADMVSDSASAERITCWGQHQQIMLAVTVANSSVEVTVTGSTAEAAVGADDSVALARCQLLV